MQNSATINIRISVEQHKFVKEMDGSFTKIWQLGFDEWSRNFPEFLQKKAKEYQNMYMQCIDKMQKCIGDVYTKNRELNDLIKQYAESGRSLEHPTPLDKNWVKARVTKLNGISTEKFFDYAINRFNNGKQQFLPDIYEEKQLL
jgi:hypothetical protein